MDNLLAGHVLIVDDEPFILKTTAQVLKNLGFKFVETASSVNEAMKKFMQLRPSVQLIMSDLNMPGEDGLVLFQNLHDNEYDGQVILFSGEDAQTLDMAKNLAVAQQLSTLGVLNKPVEPDKLKHLLSFADEPSVKKQHHSTQHTTISPDILKSAILNEEIEPWFQPKIDLARLEPAGFEVLARWHSSELNKFIFPDEFIPLAEENQLIDDLTLLIAKKAFHYQAQWRELGINLKICLNISMDSLKNKVFPEKFFGTITAPCDPTNLLLEVTESRFNDDQVASLQTLLRFRMKKIGLSIDDFGTGHSNLGQLRDLPFDELKIDRSYVQQSQNNAKTQVILESTIKMAKLLNMTVVAEGIELLEDWNRMIELGCDQVQGYFIAKPMPGDEIPDWLKNWPRLINELLA